MPHAKPHAYPNTAPQSAPSAPAAEAISARTLNSFLGLARQHFGLAKPESRRAKHHKTRPWRNLMVLGALGSLLAGPALADDTPDTGAEIVRTAGSSIDPFSN